MEKKYYTYLLRCRDGSLYCGYTDDLNRRLKAHNEGKGAKYTRAHGPCELVYFEEYENKCDAMSREYEIKQLRKAEKEKLIMEKGDCNDISKCMHDSKK